MKNKILLLLVGILLLTSCGSVRVVSDYDPAVNYATYTSFAFFKPGIDKAPISDLDKKRILRAIEVELTSKNLQKSNTPNLLVSIFTKEKERVDVYQNQFGFGWGWNPWWGFGNMNPTVSRTTEGVLFIDLIDAATKELVWQGKATAKLLPHKSVAKREARIQDIVREIFKQFPPEVKP